MTSVSDTDDLNSDFDNIKLDDLSLGSDFIKEYLSPKRETGDNIEEEEMVCEDGDEKKAKSVTILEPRNDEMVCQSVLNNFMYNGRKTANYDRKRTDSVDLEER